MKRLVDLAATKALAFCVKLFSGFDFRTLSRFSILGKIFGALFPIRRRLVVENLMKTGLARDEASASAIAGETYVCQFQNLLEFFWMGNLVRTDEVRKNFRIHGLSHLAPAIERRTGGIVASAHMGNWEMLSVALGKLGLKMNVLIVERDLEIHRAANACRSVTGVTPIDRNHAAIRCFRMIRKKELAGIVSDQHTDNAGVATKFFGLPCMTTGLPAALSLKTGAPIYCIFMIRSKDMRSHDIYIEPPIYAKDFAVAGGDADGARHGDADVARHGDADPAVARCMQAVNDVIEKYVRMAPEQWFWFHKRWR